MKGWPLFCLLGKKENQKTHLLLEGGEGSLPSKREHKHAYRQRRSQRMPLVIARPTPTDALLLMKPRNAAPETRHPAEQVHAAKKVQLRAPAV